MTTFSERLRYQPVSLAGMLAVLLAAAEMFVDWTTWIELNVSIVYGLPLVLAGIARNRWLLWSLTSALVSMTFIVYVLQISPGAFSLTEPYFLDRVLSATTLLLLALLLHARILVVDALDTQRRSLEEQNRQLDAANQQLSLYKEEITWKNEELDRRRLEAEAASGRKMRMLASVSHDIRTPVNAITLMAEVIRRAADNPALTPQVPGLATRLHANARSLADLVSDVLDISSFDSGRPVLHESEFSLNELLTELCSRLTPVAHAKGLQLEMELPAQALCLKTDRTKLDRVLSNIVSNAIKYTGTGGVTIIADAMPERGAVVCVRDTGIGIAPEDLPRVFDEFARMQSSGSTAKAKDGGSAWPFPSGWWR